MPRRVLVGNNVLTPGFTDYGKRIQYQTYDVTSLVASGKNVLGAVLGADWFASGMTWDGLAYLFQPPPTRLLAVEAFNCTDMAKKAWHAA